MPMPKSTDGCRARLLADSSRSCSDSISFCSARGLSIQGRNGMSVVHMKSLSDIGAAGSSEDTLERRAVCLSVVMLLSLGDANAIITCLQMLGNASTSGRVALPKLRQTKKDALTLGEHSASKISSSVTSCCTCQNRQSIVHAPDACHETLCSQASTWRSVRSSPAGKATPR